MGKGKSTGKVRFDGLDVAAIVTQLQRTLLGRRIINIYDGVSDADSFLFKLDGSGSQGKALLFLESGIRIHTTLQSSLQQEGMPSPFCSKLRKHLRGLRLERISQLGNYDRVVHLVFGSGEKRHSLILELYARGNLILTTASYEILALLRSHDYQEHAVQVKVGQVYPVTFATSLGDGSDAAVSKGILAMTGSQALEWATLTLTPKEEISADTGKKGKKNDSGMPLKALLLKPSSGVYHYGPSLLEHCILCANLDPNMKLKADDVATVLDASQWGVLITSLQEQGAKIVNDLSTDEVKGYILYRPKPGMESTNEKQADGMQHRDKVFEEFQPHLLKQHEGRPFLQFDTFSEAVDDFFATFGSQKQALRAEAAETAARDRLEKIRQDQKNRIESLAKEQDKLKEHAQLIELHAEDVEKALGVINSALDTGMDWEALEQLVEAEQQNQNPVALLIKRLELEKDSMILALPNVFSEGEKESSVDITVSLRETAHGNASDMFARYRAAKEKSVKTEEASVKALKAAEATAQRDLADAKKRSKLTTDMHQKRKSLWFEKFHWMITSDNYLVVGGRDAQQNEMLVKRYLRPGDAYLHADVHGASSCILRAKRRRTPQGRTEPLPLPDQALREAGSFTICRSSAWASRMVTSAWWVESHQVSKTAPTGEYLTVGSFMVRGKKNYLPPSQLEMGLAVLFRLGDEDSIARHRNERRDFSLIDEPDYDDDDDEGMPVLAAGTAKEAKSLERPDSPDITATLGAADESKEASPNKLSESSGVTNNEVEETTTAPIFTDQNGGDSLEPSTSGNAKKKGLSVKDRKLIKKHGSLEAAEKAAAKMEETNGPSATGTEQESVNAPDSSSQGAPKRGKKSKLKRAAKKYADQDEEERELALLALHAGEKKTKKSGGGSKNNNAPVSAAQEKVAAETAALLVKDPKKVAEQLPDVVRDILAECVAAQDPTASDPSSVVLRWDKFDADVLEQLIEIESEEQQLTAAKRLLFLKQSTRIDNFSASLAGIIRTILKYGHENLETNADTGADESELVSKRKTKAEKEAEDEAWKETLAQEGIVDEDTDQDAIDDTTEISKLTGKPYPEDQILYAIPVCAPYQSLSQYKYRVKLTPGNLKRGKAAKQCVDILTKSDGDKSVSSEQNRAFIKRVPDGEWVQAICADVKISAAGASKVAKKQKSGGKAKGKKKK